jgi:DNA-binding NtrC family response regulator
MTDPNGGLVVRRVRVRVTGGPDRGREALLEAGTLLVGTHPDNDLVLRDPMVGKYHLELALVAGGVRVRDLGAEGGTFVTGYKVSTSIVPPGTEVILGRTALQLLAADLPVPVVQSERASFGPVLGRAAPMRELFALLERIAPTDAPVTLECEAGGGSTLVAKAIHAASRFAASPMAVIDFALPPQERPSLPHIAQRTDTFTLLLEHVDEAPASATAELLSLYERREEGVLDARIIATTRTGLRPQAGDARARRELLAHITAVRIALPSLRARIEDIPLLVRQFAREICGVEPQFKDEDFARMVVREYPGNVRELRQLVGKALATDDAPRAQLPRAGLARARAALVLPLNAKPKPPNPKVARDRLVEAFERDWLATLHARYGGDLNEVSRESGIPKPDLQKQLKAWGVGEKAPERLSGTTSTPGASVPPRASATPPRASTPPGATSKRGAK